MLFLLFLVIVNWNLPLYNSCIFHLVLRPGLSEVDRMLSMEHTVHQGNTSREVVPMQWDKARGTGEGHLPQPWHLGLSLGSQEGQIPGMSYTGKA